MTGPIIPLDQLKLGTRARIATIDWASLSESEASRLRSFGFDVRRPDAAAKIAESPLKHALIDSIDFAEGCGVSASKVNPVRLSSKIPCGHGSSDANGSKKTAPIETRTQRR